MAEQHPSMILVYTNAILYVLSGVTQPIQMAYATHAGLANPKCQLYMLFYYIGPALAIFTFRCSPRKQSDGSMQHLLSGDDQKKRYNAQDDNSLAASSHKPKEIEEEEEHWPSDRTLLLKASGIAMFDLFAQSMVYTGNNLAGPTVFAIIYSSVTIWAAIFSRVLLSRSMVKLQWAGVCLVVLGLALTARDSKAVGENVFMGAILVFVGSSFHGLTYVMCERIMTPSPTNADNSLSTNDTPKERDHLSARANCAIQGMVATLAFLFWQIFYTLPRLEPLILAPMRESNTTALEALFILGSITVSSFVHSLTYYGTLKYFPGGATSAGILKGLQAVLVFAAGAYFLCEKWGGREMCWSDSKFVSLVVVVSGIMMYGAFTEKKGTKNVANEDVDIL